MKGSNKIEFNQATIVEAVQEYLNKRLTASAGTQTVQSVSANAVAVYGGGTYTVTIEEKTT